MANNISEQNVLIAVTWNHSEDEFFEVVGLKVVLILFEFSQVPYRYRFIGFLHTLLGFLFVCSTP